jgi:hypothetical protein
MTNPLGPRGPAPERKIGSTNMVKKRRSPIPWATVHALAVAADVCPATLVKAARGEPVRGRAGDRARAILAAALAEGALQAIGEAKP